MYKEDLVLNNRQGSICHKSQTHQIIYIKYIYKEDLALNNLNSWYVIKPNQTKLYLFKINI